MSDVEKAELTPEAIKMLNEMAERKAKGIELTPEAQANLEKIGNFHLTHTYKAYKDSYAILAVAFCGIAIFAGVFTLNSLLEHPEKLVESLPAIPIIGGFIAIVLFVAARMWKNYKRL